MKIFITGATGVIGRRVVPLLLEKGHEVTVGSRANGRRSAPWMGEVRAVPVNLFDPATLGPALRGHEAVINLATHMPSSSAKMLFRRFWRENDRIRREGSRNLVQAALESDVRRLLQESFAPAYPDRGDQWIDESVPLQPLAYNKTVVDAEASARRFSAAGRVGVILRFAAFYGPDSYPLKDFIRGLRRGWAFLPGDPRGFISSVSHDDAAAAVVAALDATPGEYNVVEDEPVRRQVYAGTLAGLIGARPPRFPPAWATPLFGVARALARSLRISNRKLRDETGWRPRYPSVREGWVATLREMNANRGNDPVTRDNEAS
jgi:2-alkyl-3-oxoalkanoate reductase